MSDNTYSFTKVDTFCQCGFKYKLIYLDNYKFYTPSIATEFGSLVHSTEEAIAKYIIANEPINYTQLKNQFILEGVKLQAKYPQDFVLADKNGLSYTDKIYSYLEKGIYRLEQYLKLHPSYQIIGTEIGFNFPYQEQYVLKGFIDRLFFDQLSNTYIIQDIKTYSAPIENSKLKVPLQFLFYALAVQNKFNCSASQIKCEYDLPLCDLIQPIVNTQFIAMGEEQLNKIFQQLYAGEFKPNPTPLCHWCDFCSTNPNQPEQAKGLCPYHTLWTRENKTMKTLYKWQGIDQHDTILELYKRQINQRG